MNIFNINAEVEKRYSALVIALAAITGMVIFLSRSEVDYTFEVDILIFLSLMPLCLLFLTFTHDFLTTKSNNRFQDTSDMLYRMKLQSDLIDEPILKKTNRIVLINGWERLRMEAIVEHRQDVADEAQKEIDKLKQEHDSLEQEVEELLK
ncbi:hypothetical protein ACT9XH_01195 [Methanococcoides methylutens]|uniref:hypothetical protein n=1 Tax=Methanococcoides methylutens TaxID=2226 RepID=UPI0040442BB3